MSLSKIQDGSGHESVFESERMREDNKVSESKMAVAESKMAEFKMAAIIKLSQNEWVKFILLQNGWIQNGRIQDG